MRAFRLLALLLVLAGLLAACGGGGAPAPTGSAATGPVVGYVRTWPDGLREELTIDPDGRMLMKHGEHLERLVLEPAQLERVEAALAAGVVAGDPEASPERVVTLADGTVVTDADPAPGSAVELLDQLIDTHSLG